MSVEGLKQTGRTVLQYDVPVVDGNCIYALRSKPFKLWIPLLISMLQCCLAICFRFCGRKVNIFSQIRQIFYESLYWFTILALLCLMMFTDKLNRSISTTYHTFIRQCRIFSLLSLKSLLCQTMKLKDIMKERREILSLTQQDLAEMAQCGLATSKFFLSGKGNPSI